MIKSDEINIHWQGKEYSSKDDLGNESELEKITGAAGTVMLQHQSAYWEMKISFNLRGINNGCYAICAGVCASHKLDAIQSLASNFFFYGVTFGKRANGSPNICCINAGRTVRDVNLKPSRHYNCTIGFLYDAKSKRLSVIDITEDAILFNTDTMKGRSGSNCEYLPCFYTDDVQQNNERVTFRTGFEIPIIPTIVNTLVT